MPVWLRFFKVANKLCQVVVNAMQAQAAEEGEGPMPMEGEVGVPGEEVLFYPECSGNACSARGTSQERLGSE